METKPTGNEDLVQIIHKKNLIIRKKNRLIGILTSLLVTVLGYLFFQITTIPFTGTGEVGGPIDREEAYNQTDKYRRLLKPLFKNRSVGLYHDKTSLKEYIDSVYGVFVDDPKHQPKDSFHWQIGFGLMAKKVKKHLKISVCLNPVMVSNRDSTKVIDYFSARNGIAPATFSDTTFFLLDDESVNKLVRASGNKTLFYDNGQLWP